MAEPYLLEAKIIPGVPYRENGLEIYAGLSWISIDILPYDLTESTNAYFTYAVCKCRIDEYQSDIYPLKVNEIQLIKRGDYAIVLFDRITPETRD